MTAPTHASELWRNAAKNLLRKINDQGFEIVVKAGAMLP
jgi:hypothetical protein